MSRGISMYLLFIITFKITLCFQKTERAWHVTHILLGFVITNTPEPDCLKYRQLNEVFGQRLVRLAEKKCRELLHLTNYRQKYFCVHLKF